MRTLLVAVACALVLPATALGHASLLSSSPRSYERVETAPRAVTLRFTQSVETLAGSVEVRTAGGKLVSRRARVAGRNGQLIRAPLARLARGAYTVRWRALAGDGHVVAGVFTFGVRHPAPPVTEAFGAAGPTRADHAVRWAYFAALALLLGALAFRLVVLRDRSLPPAAERRFYAVATIGVVATVDIGIVAFLVRAEGALQLPFTRMLYGDLTPIANGTRFGIAFIAMTLGFALVAALLFLAWLFELRALLWAAFLVALGFASGLSLSGHSGTDPGWLSAFADWVHLAAGTVWLGGLVQLAFVVWPAAPALRREAFLRFSRMAGALVALLVAAGVYLSVQRLPDLADLWREGYGRVLLVKLSLVTLALAWGAFHHFFVRPLVERGAGEAVLARVPRSLVGESAVGMAILLAAAVLVDSQPPERPALERPQAAVTVPR